MDTETSTKNNTKSQKKKRLSKFGKAMRDGILKGSIVEISTDPWNLAEV